MALPASAVMVLDEPGVVPVDCGGRRCGRAALPEHSGLRRYNQAAVLKCW